MFTHTHIHTAPLLWDPPPVLGATHPVGGIHPVLHLHRACAIMDGDDPAGIARVDISDLAHKLDLRWGVGRATGGAGARGGQRVGGAHTGRRQQAPIAAQMQDARGAGGRQSKAGSVW